MKWNILSIPSQSYHWIGSLTPLTKDSNWMKLKELNFHTLEVTIPQIDSMIMTFGDWYWISRIYDKLSLWNVLIFVTDEDEFKRSYLLKIPRYLAYVGIWC